MTATGEPDRLLRRARGRSQRPARPRSSGPTASWPSSIIPTSTRIPEPRNGSSRSARRTTCSPTPSSARGTTPSAPTSAACPTMSTPRNGPRPSGCASRCRPASAGMAVRRRRGGVPGLPPGSVARTGTGPSGLGPHPGGRPAGEHLVEPRRCVPRRPTIADHGRSDRPAEHRGEHPRRGDRRADDPTPREGRARHRRRSRRRPLSPRDHRARPALSRLGPRHRGRPSAGPVGGRVGSDGSRRGTRRAPPGSRWRPARRRTSGCASSGKGIPTKGKEGDLYARVKIVVPEAPSSEEQDLYSRLAEISDFQPRSNR